MLHGDMETWETWNMEEAWEITSEGGLGIFSFLPARYALLERVSEYQGGVFNLEIKLAPVQSPWIAARCGGDDHTVLF